MGMSNAWTALSAAGSAGEVLGEAGMTVVIGLVVVFSVLILLTFIFWLFGKVMSGAGGKKAAPSSQEKADAMPAVSAPAPVPAAPAPVVSGGVSDEVVAVIAAAVAAMAPEGKRYAVRRVSRVRGERPVWAAAGIAENTRPF